MTEIEEEKGKTMGRRERMIERTIDMMVDGWGGLVVGLALRLLVAVTGVWWVASWFDSKTTDGVFTVSERTAVIALMVAVFVVTGWVFRSTRHALRVQLRRIPDDTVGQVTYGDIGDDSVDLMVHNQARPLEQMYVRLTPQEAEDLAAALTFPGPPGGFWHPGTELTWDNTRLAIGADHAESA